jgi:hypothetical protein
MWCSLWYHPIMFSPIFKFFIWLPQSSPFMEVHWNFNKEFYISNIIFHLIHEIFLHSLLLNFIFIQCRLFDKTFPIIFINIHTYLINLYLILMDSVKLMITFLHMMDKPNNDIPHYLLFSLHYLKHCLVNFGLNCWFWIF